MDVKALTKAS